MKLTTTRSLLRPSSFFRRRRRRSGGRPFFTGIGRRRGGAAAENPEPSSPKVTCIGQVRVKSQKRVNQCRRRINGEASFRSAEPSFQQQRSRRSRRDQQRSWLHLPSISVILRALGHEFCCLFRCCTCSYSERRERGGEREKMKRSGSTGCFADESGRGELFGRWLVAVNGCDGGGRREIEVVVGGGGDEAAAAAAAEILSAGNSRRHVFDDIEVIGDRIEVKGRSFVDGEGGGGVSVSIPPKNALLLMRCRSDPIKMAAIANRISSDAVRYENGGAIRKQEEEEEEDDQSLEGEDKICVAQVLEQEKEMLNAGENGCNEDEEKEEEIEKQFNEEEDEEEEEEVESNMSSFEALLEQENTQIYQDCPIQDDPRLVEAKSEESTKSEADKKTSTNNDDDNRDPSTVEESDKQEKNAAPLPENQEAAAAAAAATLPDCLLLMMREPKLSMEVSKETWVCATDFIRLLPERPRRAAAKVAGDHEPAVRRRAAVEKSNKPRVPPPPSRKNDVQPARSSCSLPAATAGPERKRVGGDACEPLALTRCKSEPMSTAAAKLMPESGCWKENVGMQLEPHRQASLGVGAAGVGF